MKDKQKITEKNSSPPAHPDFELAFDIGHSSLGWAVLQSEGGAIDGCGAVVFRADDCLASARRGYRRQRRHIRSTRQRIARMKLLLKHLGVLSGEQLDQPGCAWPWLLAAKVLRGGGLLAWPELWDVLRWYAHNRGYDGNRRWSAAEAEANAEDTEKEENAKTLMGKHGVNSMAETFCAELRINPLGGKKASTIRFKGLNAAFPRAVVEGEVRRILRAHLGNLPKVDAKLERALLGRDNRDKTAWQEIPCAELKLPKRYEGALLFGQLVPRFDNRIISKCPVSGQKVPSRNCPEFLNFRWGMLLANIQVARQADGELRPLSPEERQQLDTRMRAVGSMTEKQFKAAVREVTGASRDSLDRQFMEVNQKEALELDRVQARLTSGHAAILFPTLPAAIQKRARGKLRRGKPVTFGELGSGNAAFEAALQEILNKAAGKGSKKQKPLTRDAILGERLQVVKLSGRAAYARPILRKAFEEVMAGRDPREKGGCLEMRQAQMTRELAEQTNNHLVRHRLLILERLLADIIKEYAGGNEARIGKITIELARDLQEMSGMDSQEKAKKEFAKLANHKEVSEKLAEALVDSEGKPLKDSKGRSLVSAALIRKARIAHDLNRKCPYTGREYEFRNLVDGDYDLDHIIPRSKRLSDALEALVVTARAVNAEKKQRTALQFIREMNLPQNLATRDRLGVWTEKRYLEFVDSLWPRRDPFARARAGGPKATDDEARCWRRKQLLLKETWEEKEFTPADLAKTRVVTKLAAQRLKTAFGHLPQEQQPPVIAIPGAVTAAFRDRAWKLLNELQAVHPEVARVLQEGEAARLQGKNFNPKKAVRDVTHLHHAVDAIGLALVAAKIVSYDRAGLDGELARLIVKGKLTAEERATFEAKRHQLRLPRFYRWRIGRNDDQKARSPDSSEGGTLCFDELSAAEKEQIRQRLAEKRVVQHIPARMDGLRVEQNTWGVKPEEKDGMRLLHQRIRQPDGSWKKKEDIPEKKVKLLGLEPSKSMGKLAAIKGVLVIPDNYGVAILDHAEDKNDRFVIIPWHMVYKRIFKGLYGEVSEEKAREAEAAGMTVIHTPDGRWLLEREKSLIKRNGGKLPRILRNGQIIHVAGGTYKGTWKVTSIKNQKSGIKLNLGQPDTVNTEEEVLDEAKGRRVRKVRSDCKHEASLASIVSGVLEVPKVPLTGFSI